MRVRHHFQLCVYDSHDARTALQPCVLPFDISRLSFLDLCTHAGPIAYASTCRVPHFLVERHAFQDIVHLHPEFKRGYHICFFPLVSTHSEQHMYFVAEFHLCAYDTSFLLQQRREYPSQQPGRTVHSSIYRKHFARTSTMFIMCTAGIVCPFPGIWRVGCVESDRRAAVSTSVRERLLQRKQAFSRGCLHQPPILTIPSCLNSNSRKTSGHSIPYT